jgi:hypothetical protein
MRRTIHRSPGQCAFFVWSWPLRVLALRRGQAPQALRRFGSPAFEAVPDPSGPGNAAATLPRGRLSGWSALVRSESRQLAHEGATPPSTARVVPALGRGRLSGRFALVRSESRQLAHSGTAPPATARSNLPRAPDGQASGQASSDGCLPASEFLPFRASGRAPGAASAAGGNAPDRRPGAVACRGGPPSFARKAATRSLGGHPSLDRAGSACFRVRSPVGAVRPRSLGKPPLAHSGATPPSTAQAVPTSRRGQVRPVPVASELACGAKRSRASGAVTGRPMAALWSGTTGSARTGTC